MPAGEPQLFASDDDRGLPVSPKWSADGKSIAFLRAGSASGGALFVKPAAGGEERFIGMACNGGVSWTENSRSVVASSHEGSDPNARCEITLFPISPGEPSRQLGIFGSFPTTSPDGKMLAFVRNHEIRLIPLTPDGRIAGPEKILAKEDLEIVNPAWMSDGKEILYLLREDRSLIRRIEVRPGSSPYDALRIDGEFLSLTCIPRGDLLGDVRVHDDSLWRVDLQSSKPRPEKLRQLPWNVHSLRIAPDGRTIAHVISERGGSGVYTSNLDGSQPRQLFRLMYQHVEQLDWSPDGREIAFTAEPALSQVEPSHLFIAPTANGSPRRLLEQFDYVYQARWSRDGKKLYFQAQSDGKYSLWRLSLRGNELTQITQTSAQPIGESVDGKFLYLTQNPFEVLRIPADGGSEEFLVPGALRPTIGEGVLYFERQDSKPPIPQGLNLYRFDPRSRSSELVTNVGFLAESLQLSPDGRFLYLERHEPPRERIVSIQPRR